ncbi:S-layer homology domain-containing protein [Brevibacillus sp. SYSU BS000544]|uniref:S-layer homology domain-containing protein n=1 Tax=Brevibacillus sp. SYSU BS000544 TaxID=3416443 RepID=UPI003CE5C398
MRQKWLIWLTSAVLLLTSWISSSGSGMAEEATAAIQAKQVENKLQVNGNTSPTDPTWVPLLVKDAQGQLLYFQDVGGGGKEFQLEINLPEWTAYGTAEAILYSGTPVSQHFEIKKPQDTGSKKISVSLKIIGYDDEEIVKNTSFRISQGSSVFQLLRYASEEKNFDYEVRDPEQDGQDVYLLSIDGLAEFDKGPGSGWVYKVNDKGPPMSIDRYMLRDGDDVEILYTTDMGKSQNVTSGDSISNAYQATTSAYVSSAINQLVQAKSVDEIVTIVHNLLIDLSNYELEKQAAFVPDVAVFLQAAYEQAGKMQVKESRIVNPLEPDIQELSLLKTRELMDDQSELLEELNELLENSTLYKPLLKDLKQVILVPFPVNSESRVAKVFIYPDSWERLRESHVSVVLAKDGWRAEITPANEPLRSKETISYTIRQYSDAEQTKQFAEWQSSLDEPAVPVTASYHVDASQPDIATITLSTALTGSIDDLTVPSMYTRNSADAKWTPSIALIANEKETLSGLIVPGNDLVMTTTSHSFEDVMMLPESRKELQKPISALYQWGITQGMTPASFGVDQPLTRAQFFTMVARLEQPERTEQSTAKTGESPASFSDVPESSWFAPTVKKAVQLGWTKGRNQHQFAPDEEMTRSEVASLLVRLYEQEHTVAIEENAAGQLDLTGVPDWAKHAMVVATANKWLMPRDNGKLDSQAAITRGEAAYAVYQYYVSKNK